ncbi:HAL/PAL/TAL family ammonia-lyase [Rhodospirillaceae bacterium SYSU D60014]|uniref:HAL/PAL/TAL family ammonia-lyase n=1 Tax=Virgifigura deserti TaxID=2268457 RepID=UPI000E66E5F2
MSDPIRRSDRGGAGFKPAPTLTGNDLTPDLVAQVARDHARVDIDPAAASRLKASRAVVERFLAEDRPVYGLTTGLGPRATMRLPQETLAEFSRLTVLGRAQAVGPRLSEDVVRAAMLIRANGMVKGGAGVQPSVPEMLVAMLNAGVHPVMPAIASIGAADLCLMAHIGLAAIGEGEAVHHGETLPAAEALKRAGLQPLELGPKDGLALCSANAVSAGQGALALSDATALSTLLDLAAALSMEGFRANLSPIDPRIAAARPAPGQEAAAAHLRALLAGGALTEPGAARRVQDPISLRCVSHVHGSLRAALDFAAPALQAELNGAGDNPLVLVEDGEMLSTGNFHTPALALAFDTAGLAISQTATLLVNRITRLLTERLSDLPAMLSPRAPTRSGFGPLTKTAEALAAEIRHLANPVSIDSRGGIDVEDDSTNAPLAARKLADMLERLRLLVALELVVATQAVDLAKVTRLGRGTAIAHAIVRELVQPLDEDRPLGGDIERVAAEALASGRLLAAVRAVLSE